SLIIIDVKQFYLCVEILLYPCTVYMTILLSSLLSRMGCKKTHKHTLNVKDALKLVRDEEAARLVNEDDLKAQAVELVENKGIVFLDEIDKIARSGQNNGDDVSSVGHQRDLLPLIVDR